MSDAVGNAATTASQAITVDETSPTIAITSPVAGDNIINKSEAAAGVTISGTATAGSAGVNGQTATITIVDSTNAVKDTYTATVTGGAWSVNVTAAQAQALADGSYSIKANVSDAAGNAATTASQAITVDETAPTIAITSPVAGDNIINKTEAAAGVTISGTATAGSAGVNGQTATITIIDNTNTVKDIYTATVAAGAWSVNVTAAQAQGLADGSYSIKANVSDAAGNAATTATQAITVDETAPTIAITSPVAGDNIINKSEAAAGVAISGAATAGSAGVNGQTATITIVDSTNTVKDIYTATVTGGAWSVNVTAAQAQALVDGSYSIKANLSDIVGNSAITASQAIAVDETSPTIAITSPVAGDNVINKTEAAAGVTISGTATAGSGGAAVNGQTATITIVDSTNAVKDTYTATVTAGAWSVNVTAAQAQALADGSYSIKANVSDAAGNAATTASQAIALDTLPPTVAISTSGATTSQSTQTISGTVAATEAAAGATVTLYDTINSVTTQIGTATVVGGSWSTSVTLSGNGTHSIVAKDTDAAGNIGTSLPVTFTLSVIANGWANPGGGSWNTGANWSSGTVPLNTANVVFNPIGATAPYTATILSGATVAANSITLSDPEVTLLDEGALTIAASLTIISGFLEIENGGTLSLGGASSFTVDFAGTGGNLVLGNSPGFTGTINALSTATGPVTITGSGAVTASSGDAIDLTASGGTVGSPANLGIALSGAITGAGAGISAIQSANGDIVIATSGSVIGLAGRGIIAEETSTGVGNILVDGTGDVTGTGNHGNASAILAENLNPANSGNVVVSQTGNIIGGTDGIHAFTDGNGNVTVTTAAGKTISGATLYGIEAASFGTGNVSVTTALNDVITSASVGLNVYNQATAVPQVGGATVSTITVTANGTINSGALPTGSGSRPAGILAGYAGATTATPNANVFGNVTISNSANINAEGGDGIRGYNYGNGNVSVSDQSNTTITADEFGIDAVSYGVGSVSISTVAQDVINSGSSGLQAINLATSIPTAALSTTSVTAHGTINSGTNLTPGGSQPQGISAGYLPGNTQATNNNVNGTVTVDNFANVTALAGFGINTYNFGDGSITVTDETGTTVSGAQYGIQAYSQGTVSGDLTIAVKSSATITAGSLYGLAGINAFERNPGNISIATSSGDTINSGGTGIQTGNQMNPTTGTSSGQISITTFGTINSGFDTNTSGGQPSGIWAGYNPGGAGIVNTHVAGNVTVDNSATINAASGAGIGLYNFGVGSLSATLEASSLINAVTAGLNVFAQGGGNVTLINNGKIADPSGAGIITGTGNGLTTTGHGIISITNTNTGSITGLGSVGNALIQINNDSANGATLTNSGTLKATLASGLNVAIGANNGTVTTNTGGVTVNNTGTISGNVSLGNSPFNIASATFNNNAGGIWNVNGFNWFGGTLDAVSNAGTINASGVTTFAAVAGGTLTFTNSLSGTVNLLANSYADIAAAVSGGGTFSIGDHSNLEFATSVVGSIVSFVDGKGMLTLDSPSSFSGSIANLVIGDTIDLFGGTVVTGASITGNTLTVTTTSQPLTFTVSNAQSGTAFDVLAADKIVMVSSAATQVTGSSAFSSGPLTATASYIFANDAISATAPGINITSSDSVSGDFATVYFNQTSSITETGSGVNAVNITTAGASIAFVSAGTISASGGIGINTNSSSGSTDIIDYGNVSGSSTGIRANGSGSINVVVGAGATVTGTSGSAVLATSTLGSLSVSTTPGVVINAGVSGLVAENQGTSVPQVGGITTNSIIVSASGTINSGTGTSSSGEPVGILAGYLGGTSFPSTIPAPSTTVFGNVSVNSSANINAATGMGILAVNYGQGDISVTDAGGTIIQATAAGTTASGLTQYGIAAFNYGSGNTTVATGPGSTINSGGTGINVSNQATANVAASTITVVAQGAINSGANNNNSGGAASGIQAGFNPGNLGVFNGSVNGNVLVNYSNGNIVAAAGDGIVAYDYGNGNIAVNLGFNANISALNSGPSGKAPFGIAAFDYGTGNIAVTTSGGGVISSGSSGINASNQATAIAATAGALVTVSTAAGLSISSGTIPNNSSGSLPSGIVAGFLGGTSQTSNSGLGANGTNGTIIVNNAANITAAAGYGINAYNYGSGDVTVNEAGSTTVSGVTYGIYAHAESGSGYVNGAVSPSGNTVSGTGNIAINIYAGASSTSQTIINATSSYGIFAYSTDLGNISVITGTNVTINSGSVGIDAVNGAATIPPASPNSSIVVTSSATINSGTAVTGTGASPAGIIAGYLGPSPGGVVTTTFPLTGINGDVVVNNFGNITAASGDGIRAFNYGIGDVTVNDNAGTIIAQGGVNTTAGYGDGINASNEGTGDINVTTAAGTVIDSHLAASGIVAINKAPAPSTSSVVIPATSEISVSAHGTILSGAMQTLSGDPAAGILAGYNPNSADLVNPNVAGSVWVDDYANITAVVGTDGIRGINYGTGAVTIVTEAGADISAGRYGIGAFAYDGGDVSVTNHAYVTGATAAVDALATSGGTVFIDNYGMITGDVVSSGNTTFHNEAGAIWNLAGSSTFTGTSTLINDGAIDTTGVSSIATSGVLSIANNGVVEVQSGSLDVAAGVTGLGTFTIDSGGLLEFATSVAAGSVIAFQGTAATLKLDDVAHFTGSVTGFAFGDTIDLVGISLASVSVSNPGSLQIGYGTGSIALGGNYNPADFTVVTDGHGGTDVTWNHQAPVISTGSLTVTQNSNGTTTITGLQVSDSDAAASSETFTISATTGAASSGTSVSPSTGSGLLTAINTELGTGITYNPGATPPSTDKVALTVTDGFGATDTVNFVFNLASSPTAPVTLAGTSGKDVIFATGNNDTLTGGGGADQFVFNHTTGAHTITDFSTINDHIDLTALSSIVTAATFNAWLASNVTASATSPADTVISLGGTETITLHNVLAANVSASDFIVHA
ncbi:MAG: beta strand repeat-containing protein [Bradyrhizobium sp.]